MTVVILRIYYVCAMKFSQSYFGTLCEGTSVGKALDHCTVVLDRIELQVSCLVAKEMQNSVKLSPFLILHADLTKISNRVSKILHHTHVTIEICLGGWKMERPRPLLQSCFKSRVFKSR